MVLSNTSYRRKETHKGLFKGAHPLPTDAQLYVSGIECLITLVEVYLFRIFDNKIPMVDTNRYQSIDVEPIKKFDYWTVLKE